MLVAIDRIRLVTASAIKQIIAVSDSRHATNVIGGHLVVINERHQSMIEGRILQCDSDDIGTMGRTTSTIYVDAVCMGLILNNGARSDFAIKLYSTVDWL